MGPKVSAAGASGAGQLAIPANAYVREDGVVTAPPAAAGTLAAANNLSDVSSPVAALSNLGALPAAGGTMTGNIAMGGNAVTGISALAVSGLTGATAGGRWVGTTAAGAPTSGTFLAGDWINDLTGQIWICTTGGTQGAWVNPATAAALALAPSGATGETFSRRLATGGTTSTLSSGLVYVNAIWLPAGVPVSNITLAAGSGTTVTQADLTHGWYALLDSTLTVRAVSADQIDVAFWNATGTKYPLSVAASDYVTTYSGLYYVAASVSVSAGNMPQPIVTSFGATALVLENLAPVQGGTAGTQAAPPATGTQLASGSVTAATVNLFYAYTS